MKQITGRVPFSSDEEKLLVKYIARYKPGLKGRAGNQLYIQLCEDVDNKWKWSRTHPWQSWRDRYCKNQVWYDLEIKKYQMKHGISDGEPVKQGNKEKQEEEEEEEEEEEKGKKQLRDGDAPTAPGKRKRESNDEEKRAKARRDSGQDRKDSQSMFVLGRGTSATKDGEQLGNLKVELRAPTASPPLSLNISKIPDPSVDSRAHLARSPTQTTQQRIVDPQPVASTSKVQLSPCRQSPPKITSSPRRRRQSNEEYFATPPASPSPNGPSDHARLKHRLPKLKEGPFGSRFPGRRKGTASDSNFSGEEKQEKGKVWPPVRQRDTSLKSKGPHDIAETQSGIAALQQASQDFEGLTGRPPSLPRITAHPLQTAVHAQAQAFLVDGVASPDHTTEKVPSQAQTSPVTREHVPRNSWTAADNLFIAPVTDGGRDLKREIRPPDEFVRRHTIGNSQDIQSTSGCRIDLRAVMAKRSVRSSSAVNRRSQSIATTTSLSTPRASTSASRPSPPPMTHRKEHTRSRSSLVAEEDRNRIESLGVTRAVEMMAMNFGFRDEFVRSAWEQFKSLEITEEFFRRYRARTKSVTDEVIEEMEKDGIYIDAPFVQEEIADEPHGRQASKAVSDARHQHREPKSALDFKIKPLPIERAISEYTPPSMTRAGQYMRLVKQGRVEEALSREKRRASGGSGIFPGLRSVSATSQQSPQNGGQHSKMEDDGGDQSAEEIGDVDAVENALLREEEEEAFLSANAENAPDLRSIEQRIDVDDMLRWMVFQLADFGDKFRRSLSPSL